MYPNIDGLLCSVNAIAARQVKDLNYKTWERVLEALRDNGILPSIPPPPVPAKVCFFSFLFLLDCINL